MQLALYLIPTARLRRHVPRSALAEVRSVEKGSQLGRNVQGRRHPRRAGCLLPARAVLRQNALQLVARPSVTALRGVLLIAVAHDHEVLHRLASPLRPLRHPRAGRRGRTRHGRLDSKHHRQPLHLRARQVSLHLDLRDHVQPALLRALHREEARHLADRHPAHLRRPRVRRPASWPAACRPSSVSRSSRSASMPSARPSSGRRCWPWLRDRFPRTGAIAISIMGGIGMMSAGLIGSPGLGYAKDRFATEALAAIQSCRTGTVQGGKAQQVPLLLRDRCSRRHETRRGSEGRSGRAARRNRKPWWKPASPATARR